VDAIKNMRVDSGRRAGRSAWRHWRRRPSLCSAIRHRHVTQTCLGYRRQAARDHCIPNHLHYQEPEFAPAGINAIGIRLIQQNAHPSGLRLVAVDVLLLVFGF
jgi:hypothetical protein